jgi:hypothetical protein
MGPAPAFCSRAVMESGVEKEGICLEYGPVEPVEEGESVSDQ